MKPLIEKLSMLLMLTLAIDLTAGFASAKQELDTSFKWEKAIAAFEKADVSNPPPKGGIEFIGSSTITKWTTLAQDFPGLPVFNRGFGGSQIKDTTFFASRIIIPYAPRIIVFHAGDNDLAAGATPEQVIADLKELIELVHAKLPETEFCYLSLKPSEKRKQLRLEEQQVNQGVIEFFKNTPRVHYIDQYNMVTDAQGNPRPELFSEDKMHFNEAGYKLLVERVHPFLENKTVSVSVSGGKTPEAPANVQPEGRDKTYNWEHDIAKFEKADVTNPPPKGGIEFVGSSTMTRWTTLKDYFPGLPVFNRGFGGSEISDSVRYAPRIIIPYAPRIIVFHAGGNDLERGKSPEQVFADFKELIALIKAKLPETEFYYISLKPCEKREKARAEQQKYNLYVQEYIKNTPRVHYIDQYTMVTDAEGNPRPELFAEDQRHLNEAGYKLLADKIRTLLENTTAK
ncbi:MAG: GDSL-type esterase/lipase family protein [Verrucomicrobiota bacterium]